MAQVSRLEKKLNSCFENKEYYEAHQICRTLFYRLSSAGKYDELLSLLEKGSLKLIEVKEYGSAYDLAETYSDTLVKSLTPFNQEKLISIGKIFIGLPPTIDDNLEDGKDRRVKFIATCVKWTQLVSSRPSHCARGHPSLHSLFARRLFSEGSVEMARSHFMLSDDPEEFGSFMYDWYVRGEIVEKTKEEWILAPVLQLSCLRRIRFASRLLSSYMKHSSPSSSPPYSSSNITHFSWLLLKIIPTKNVTYYSALVSKFKSLLSSDETILPYLDQIVQLYFGVEQKSQGGGLFGNLLKGLMGPQEEKKQLPSSDSEDEPQKMTDVESSLFKSELALILKSDAPVMEQVDDDLD